MSFLMLIRCVYIYMYTYAYVYIDIRSVPDAPAAESGQGCVFVMGCFSC